MRNYARAHVPGGTFFLTLVTYRRLPLFRPPAEVARLRVAQVGTPICVSVGAVAVRCRAKASVDAAAGGAGDGAVLTFTCQRRLPLFRPDRIKDRFVDRLTRTAGTLGADVLAWVDGDDADAFPCCRFSPTFRCGGGSVVKRGGGGRVALAR